MSRSSNPSAWIETRKSKNGVKYRVRSEVGGQRLPASPWMPKKAYAEQEKARVLERLWAGDLEAVKVRRKITWDEFSELYLQYSKAHKAKRTFEQFDRPAIYAFSSVASGFQLSAITPEMVAKWSMNTPGNPTTKAMKFSCLRAAFSYAVRLELIRVNPARNVPKPHSDETGRDLSDDEISRLLAEAPESVINTAIFSLNTGFRIGEITGPKGVRWENFKDGFIRVPARQRKTKRTVKKDLRAPVNEQALSVMGEPKKEGLIFNHDTRIIQHGIIAARERAGLPDDITFHSFRHTFATRYLKNGGHIEDLLEARLWASYSALLRYVHVDDETLSKRFAALRYPPTLPPKRKGRGSKKEHAA